MNQIQQTRHTAYKVRIYDLINNEFVQNQGEWEPNFVLIKDKKVSRINIICTVISKYEPDESNYISITLDDGTGTIQAKAWNEDVKKLENIEVGDLILLIGRIRKYNNSVYLTPEIAKPLENTMWGNVRKKELEKEFGALENNEIKNHLQDEIFIEPPKGVASKDRQAILEIIEKINDPDGIEIQKLIKQSNLPEENANLTILELLKEGEIFEIKPGFIKLVE